MGSDKDPARWTATVYRAVVVLVGVAVGARIIYWALTPVLPLLVGFIGLGVVLAALRGWFRR